MAVDPHSIILTTQACMGSEYYLWTDDHRLIVYWVQMIQDHLSPERFLKLWHRLYPASDMSTVRKVIQKCVGMNA